MPISCVRFWDRKMTALSGHTFSRSWMRFRSRRTDRSHTEAKTIPHAGDGFAEVYCMVPHQLCFAAHQHTQPQSQITETLRSRRFSLQSPFGENSESVRQGRSESSDPFVSALFSLRFWLGPPQMLNHLTEQPTLGDDLHFNRCETLCQYPL